MGSFRCKYTCIFLVFPLQLNKDCYCQIQVARSILEKQADADKNRLLSEIYVRLGDVKQMNEDIAGSLQEYESALKIRQVVCDPSDR